MYRIAICDNDKIFSAELHKQVEKSLSFQDLDAQIHEFYNTASFLESMDQGNHYDLIFLDILLDGENGYSFAKQLRNEDIKIDIIFITTTEDYAIAGYEVSPLLYLVKPVTDAQITYALEIFIKKHIPRQILLNLSGELVSIKLHEILYCEVYGHKTYVHLISGEMKELRFSLQKLEDLLPASVFARSHQSYLVNMEHIDRITRYKLTLSNGQTIPISQAKYLNLQNKFIAYSSQQKIRM